MSLRRTLHILLIRIARGNESRRGRICLLQQFHDGPAQFVEIKGLVKYSRGTQPECLPVSIIVAKAGDHDGWRLSADGSDVR